MKKWLHYMPLYPVTLHVGVVAKMEKHGKLDQRNVLYVSKYGYCLQ